MFLFQILTSKIICNCLRQDSNYTCVILVVISVIYWQFPNLAFSCMVENGRQYLWLTAFIIFFFFKSVKSLECNWKICKMWWNKCQTRFGLGQNKTRHFNSQFKSKRCNCTAGFTSLLGTLNEFQSVYDMFTTSALRLAVCEPVRIIVFSINFR